MNFLKLFIFIFTCSFLSAQKAENPWAVSVGTGLINILDDTEDKNQTSVSIPALSLSRHFHKGISVGVQYSPGWIGKSNHNLNHSSLDGIIKYNLSEKKFVPYLFAGFGVTVFSDPNNEFKEFYQSKEAFNNYLGGIGANFFLNDNWAISYNSSYRTSKEKYSYTHLQHIIGLSYNFGASDLDKDGINDKKDDCPKRAGLKEFKGCPDDDGDGLPNHKDSCPEKPGSAINSGCPDTDNDGITDPNDICPYVPGTLAMNGCPDSDGDRIPDNEDKCPEEWGKPKDNGCPSSDVDGDQIADQEDDCPDVKGPKSNNGCPELPTDLISFIQSNKSKILFYVNSHQLRGIDEKILNELKALLIKYPQEKITIEGHASSDGSSMYNMKLSEKRAKEVKRFLSNHGIDPFRIKTIWFGEEQPIGDNKTKKGRWTNRRAVIKK